MLEPRVSFSRVEWISLQTKHGNEWAVEVLQILAEAFDDSANAEKINAATWKNAAGQVRHMIKLIGGYQ